MGFIKSNQALTRRYLEICDKLHSDDSLMDEERKYYMQLAYRIDDEIVENLKEAVDLLNKDPIKFFEENMEKDPRTLYDFNKTLEFKNKLEKLKKSFYMDVF